MQAIEVGTLHLCQDMCDRVTYMDAGTITSFLVISCRQKSKGAIAQDSTSATCAKHSFTASPVYQ